METSTDNLMMNAKGFALSAETLVMAKDDKHDLTILHLTALSLELSFKAWLSHHGVGEGGLKKVGHHLDKAYSDCLDLGLVDATGSVGRAIALIAPIYGQNYTRYFPDIEGFQMLTPQSLVDVARAVALAVEGKVWQDV